MTANTLVQPMPAIFIGHGSPMNALERNDITREWQKLGARFPSPKTILMISAHWTATTAVTAMIKPRTIHDFGGFPDALFQAKYSAPGDPALAAHIVEILAPLHVALDQSWGLDHGAWSVLMQMYPEATIPVVQLSIDLTKSARFHYDLGCALASLRNEGVMIIGSGNIVHNLRRLDPLADGVGYDWAQRFHQKMRAAILAGNFDAVIDYENLGNDAEFAVPTTEHFLPLLYILGCKTAADQIEIFCDELMMGSISMMSVLITE
jgi:4,5-DOPA dioxygenase extradiol